MSDRNKRERDRIRAKRASSAAYRKRERDMLRKRMRELRAIPEYVRPDRPGVEDRVWIRRSPKR